MKKLLFSFAILLLLIVNSKAQTSTIGLQVKTVYVGVKIPIVFDAECPKNKKLTYQVSNGKIEQSGDTIFLIAAQKGEVDVKVMSGNKLVASSKFKAKEMPPFKITLGELNSNSVSNVLVKMQTGLKCEVPDFLHEDDYKVVSATVYFSGTGFPDVALANLYSNSIEPLRKLIEKCTAGSIITFDNIKVKGPDGIRYAEGISIILD
ncbi:MAG: hypothetical protein WCH52_04055 [Bacteroidota bacterium]